MDAIWQKIENYREDALAIRREIHRHPELSMEEFRTTALVKETLAKYGIGLADVELPVNSNLRVPFVIQESLFVI